MVEVMVTAAVVAIGLLGAAKLQAAAVSNTQVSRVRSLVALQAGSLAAAMHGNPKYWAAGTAPTRWTASGTTISDAVLSAASTCVDNSTTGLPNNLCTPPQLAAYDVQTWVANMNDQFPSYSATVTCSNTVGVPISCSIQLTWSEKTVAINASTAASAATQPSQQQFTLLVQP
jgi:type IV pilus assembly protein PilV